MPRPLPENAALLVDVENLFYGESRRHPARAQDCLTALLWWSRKAVRPAHLQHREGYTKRHDPAAQTLRNTAKSLRFQLRWVPEGKDMADRAVAHRLVELTDAGYREFVVGSIDKKVIGSLRRLHRRLLLVSHVVLPTSYQRELRVTFEPGGKNGDLQARSVIWIVEVLDQHQKAQRGAVMVAPGSAQAPSPFAAAGGFWRVLQPQKYAVDSAQWRAIAGGRFVQSGFDRAIAIDLALELQRGLVRTYGQRLAEGFSPNHRVWAKLCLTALLRAYFEADHPSDALAQFHQAAIETGSEHVRQAITGSSQSRV